MLVRRSWPSRPAFEDTFADFDQLRREMQRWLDTPGRAGYGAPGSGVFPPMNVSQDADNFYVRAEIPGIKANELQITAVKNRLSIAGKREIQSENDKVSYHRKERPEGSFNRSFTLPTELDVDHIEARYADGILNLKLPKAEAAKPRLISVKS
jgi:HSP20 family protein